MIPRFVTLSIMLTFLAFALHAQKGFQLGVGVNYMTSNQLNFKMNDYNDLLKTSNPLGLSINLDYTFNNRFKIKSGLEYQSQEIQATEYAAFNAQIVSLPLLLNYNFLNLENKGLSLGIDAGFVLDKLYNHQISSRFRSDAIDKSTQYDINITTNRITSQSLFRFSNSSFRIGLTVKKTLKTNGNLNFYAHVISPQNNSKDANISVSRQEFDQGGQSKLETYNYQLKLKDFGYQFGVYYTFGTLGFK